MKPGSTVDESTQTSSSTVDEKTTRSVLELANIFLHCSYCFMMLSLTFKHFKMPGLKWATEQREKVCRESARSIFEWVMESGEPILLADILKPNNVYDEFDLTHSVIKWDRIDKWLETRLELILEEVGGRDTNLKTTLLKILEANRNGFQENQ